MNKFLLWLERLDRVSINFITFVLSVVYFSGASFFCSEHVWENWVFYLPPFIFITLASIKWANILTPRRRVYEEA